MLSIALAVIKVTILAGQIIYSLLRKTIILPAKILADFIFRHFLTNLYRVYFAAKKKVIKIFAPAKNILIYPLLNKSTIHFIIIIITISVIANNFFIKETKAEEFGQQTILKSLITNTQDIEIIETSLSNQVKNIDYFHRNGFLASNLSSAKNTPTITNKDKIITSSSSAALIKPSLVSTTTGNRPRDKVVYYTVEGGDTISNIAEKFHISANTILWENKLGPRDYIKPGDKLTILPESGVSHQIKKGDTLEKIAKKYSVDTQKIMDYNQLADASAITEGQILIIPGGTMPETAKPKLNTKSTTNRSAFAFVKIPPPATNTGETKLAWPTNGRHISQYYKWSHLAIDITGNYSSPIYAADNGRVEKVGWGRGYGNRTIINHGNGIKTLYAHQSKIFVKVGDYVKRGQTIGMMGCTGWCTGPHVHFEVRVNGRKLNPLNYLR